MAQIDESTFQAVSNANFKNMAEQPALHAGHAMQMANMALQNAVDTQKQVGQIGQASLQMFHQNMAAMSQVQLQALAGFQMGSQTAASKSVEDQRTLDPKDAAAESGLLYPATQAGRDLGGARSFIREELHAALVAAGLIKDTSPK